MINFGKIENMFIGLGAGTNRDRWKWYLIDVFWLLIKTNYKRIIAPFTVCVPSQIIASIKRNKYASHPQETEKW